MSSSSSKPPEPPSLRTRLLDSTYDSGDHGTFTPSSAGTPRSQSPTRGNNGEGTVSSGSSAQAPHPGASKKRKKGWYHRATTTTRIAEEAGVKRPWLMYASYYVPCIAWMGEYRWSYLPGDVAAGITIASFYIPMALSLSANLAHLPPIHGLYGFAIQPLVYAILGSCPQMVVGPEAAGSLLMGTAIRLINQHNSPPFDDGSGEGDSAENARLAGVITFLTGFFALIAGGMRLGFLDSVLSKPLLRGFISGVGFVIFIDQLLPELGLNRLAAKEKITRASTITKIVWICQNFTKGHGLTCAVAFISLAIILFVREAKRKVAPRAPWVHFVPDRFFVVVLSAVLAGKLRWDKDGLEVLGSIKTEGPPFQVISPISISHLNHVKEALSTGFLISVLGFFESVIAAKSLGSTLDESVSSNRELIALGSANVIGGCFMALPSFGGYGRSKVNKATGGRTPVSNVVLAVCTILCIHFLLPSFYYIPRAVLCAMISAVAISLLEEAPADVRFFWKIHAWEDLATMAIVFLTTVVWSLTTGIAIGVGVSLIQVLRAATQAKIKILGRDPIDGQWKPVDHPSATSSSNPKDPDLEPELISGILILKIHHSLSFANAGDLARRLWRIDRYGDLHSHPSLPPTKQGVRGAVFDCAGVDDVDGSGALLVKEIVEMYAGRGVSVYFSRVGSKVWKRMERAGIVEILGGGERRTESVEEALQKMREEGAVDEV